MKHAAMASVALNDSIARRPGGGRVYPENTQPADGLEDLAHRSSVYGERTVLATHFHRFGAQWLLGKPENRRDLVGADGRLNFGFVDIEVGVDVLHVVVLLECFDQAHHLRSLRACQLDVVLRDQSHFLPPRPTPASV